MTLIIQYITIRWTKKSRSASGATLRNAVPDRLALPYKTEPKYDNSLIEHTVTYCEENQFSEPDQEVNQRLLKLGKREKYRCLDVRWEDEKAKVVYKYDFMEGGAPKRSKYPRQVLTLTSGEWGQAMYNGRHVSLFRFSGWWYKKTIINVAVMSENMKNPFEGKPRSTFSDLAHLI
ncbi:hypothetical protein [Fodinibius salsisoli]|uniref:Uncharacterized protein n=1 Tax=Fodinibius salsisoli TaxID=2820877 RepID=A0ABT3PKT1_9BACT|nr:hypothetical protein [Fodinibius salsisoli]MCW9706549.1 hypothetical protein [Fodinibius salsisoli]